MTKCVPTQKSGDHWRCLLTLLVFVRFLTFPMSRTAQHMSPCTSSASWAHPGRSPSIWPWALPIAVGTSDVMLIDGVMLMASHPQKTTGRTLILGFRLFATPHARQEAQRSHQALRHLVHSVHRRKHPTPLESVVR